MQRSHLENTASRRTFVLALVLVALALRAGVALWLSDTVPYTDFALYHVAGAEIARDPGFLFDADAGRALPQIHWWPPGYPVFLGAIYSLFGANHRAAVWVHVALGTLVCVFVYRLARRFMDEFTARVAALLVAVNPTFVFLTNQLASENLYLFWLALGLWLASRTSSGRDSHAGQQPRRRVRAFMLGVVFGLGALTRAAGLIVPLVVAAWWWRTRHAPHSLRGAGVGWMLAGLAIVITPWSVRNAVEPIQEMGALPFVPAILSQPCFIPVDGWGRRIVSTPRGFPPGARGRNRRPGCLEIMLEGIPLRLQAGMSIPV